MNIIGRDNLIKNGLLKRYEILGDTYFPKVIKVTNPNKCISGVVLEFDDPVCHEAIATFAQSASKAGFEALGKDILDELAMHGFDPKATK